MFNPDPEVLNFTCDDYISPSTDDAWPERFQHLQFVFQICIIQVFVSCID